jgi:hypothetical protein
MGVSGLPSALFASLTGSGRNGKIRRAGCPKNGNDAGNPASELMENPRYNINEKRRPGTAVFSTRKKGDTSPMIRKLRRIETSSGPSLKQSLRLRPQSCRLPKSSKISVVQGLRQGGYRLQAVSSLFLLPTFAGAKVLPLAQDCSSARFLWDYTPGLLGTKRHGLSLAKLWVCARAMNPSVSFLATSPFWGGFPRRE